MYVLQFRLGRAFRASWRRAIVDALRAEIRAHAWQWTPETVYLGGGTPSMMEPAELARLARRDSRTALDGSHPRSRARHHHCRDKPAPGRDCRNQSRQPGRAVLRRDARSAAPAASTPPQSWRARSRCCATAGIANFNIDLIAGLSGQTASQLAANRSTGSSGCAPPHVSVYMLEVDEDSRLGKEMLLGGVRYGAADTPADDDDRRLYEIAVERLARAGHSRATRSRTSRGPAANRSTT